MAPKLVCKLHLKSRKNGRLEHVLLHFLALLGAHHVAEGRRELAPRGLVAKVPVGGLLVLLGLGAERHGHLVARVDAAAVRIEVDRLRLHVPRRVERLRGEHDVDPLARLQPLAEVLRDGDLLLEEDPAPLRAPLLLDRLLQQVGLGEVLSVVQRDVNPVEMKP